MTDSPVTFVGHATVRLEIGGLSVLTDPVLRRHVSGLQRVGPPVQRSVAQGVDLVLISHAHHDHLDLPSLRQLGQEVPILAPRGTAVFLRRHGFTEVEELAPGEVAVRDGVKITATPTVHDGHRVLGPHAEAIGHLLESAELTVYFAGDTDLFDTMTAIGDHRLDLALVPIWGWGPNLGPGHLDPVRAAEAVRRLRPRISVPIHWGTLAPLGMRRMMRRQLVEPAQQFVAAAAALPGQVVVTRPGAAVEAAW